MKPETKPSLSARISSALQRLQRIRTSVFAPSEDGSSKTVHPQDTPAPETRRNENGPPPLVINSIANPPDAENNRKPNTPLWEKAAVLAAFGLLVVNVLLWCSTKKAANAAETAANVAKQQLELSTRPWVQVKGELNFKYLGFRPIQDYVRLESGMTYTLENTGNSPAFKVTEAIAPVFPTSTELPNDWRLQACRISDEMSVGKNMGGVVIMPKGTTDKPHPITVSIPIPADVKQANFIWVVGCITYQDTFNRLKNLHHTKMLYIIRSQKPVILTNLPANGLTPFPTNAIQLVDSDAD